MQKYNLLSSVRRKRYRNCSNVSHIYPNLLNRDFHADRPNQKWVTDISYIKTAQGTLYLSVIRDLYDNSIIAYKTGTNQSVCCLIFNIPYHSVLFLYCPHKMGQFIYRKRFFLFIVRFHRTMQHDNNVFLQDETEKIPSNYLSFTFSSVSFCIIALYRSVSRIGV